jgi:hypothetical protein
MFSFIDGSRILSVERFGLADVILRDADLQSWFRSYYAKNLRGYGFSFEEDQLLNNEYDQKLKLSGQERRFIDKIPFSPLFVIDKVMRRKQVVAQFWQCKESNRIFVVMAMSKKGADELVSQVASSIRCHEKSA